VTAEDILSGLPQEIHNTLLIEYSELESRFLRQDWGPSELNGGRLAEALLRYLEWKMSGTFTPLGTQINRTAVINSTTQDTSLSEGVRFHLRRCADLLMDFRNKRDVAHLGASTDVREMDAHLVLRLAGWSLSEILREEGGLHPADVQQLIDKLSASHSPLVEEIDGDVVVVSTQHNANAKVLIALHHTFPNPLPIEVLQQAVKYANPTRFVGILKKLDKEALVHFKDGNVFLTRKGIAWVESNIDFTQVELSAL